MDESQGIDLRLGYVTDLYYSLLNKKAPKQLDLLDEWFPGFVVERQSHRQHIPNVGKQMFKQQLALVETLEKWIIDFENSLKEKN